MDSSFIPFGGILGTSCLVNVGIGGEGRGVWPGFGIITGGGLITGGFLTRFGDGGALTTGGGGRGVDPMFSGGGFTDVGLAGLGVSGGGGGTTTGTGTAVGVL